MSAPAPPAALDAAPDVAPEDAATYPRRYTQRLDGWTPERQRGFLERIAEGATVDEASASVGLSPGAAYSLRRRAAGGAFALGWDAAKLVARPIVAEALFRRAIDGQVERITRADGEVIERHRYDNRLAMSLLSRLDRHAVADDPGNGAARLVAAEFDAFLDIVARDGGPARAGLFLCERIRAEGEGAGDGDSAMAPIAALARADHWLRTAAGLRSEIDTTDLDPAARAGWTAEQWARAEAAGLLCLAPPPVMEPVVEPEPEPTPDANLKTAADVIRASALSIHHDESDEDRDGDPPVWEARRVWYDFEASAWRTSFPPPPDFMGFENSVFGEDAYYRACTDDEEIILEAPHEREVAERIVAEAVERDAWFVDYAVDGALIDADAAAATGATDADRLAALARAFDPDRPCAAHETAHPDDDVMADPRQAAEPEPRMRRSPAIHLLTDGNAHEHLQQDQVRHLW